MLNWLERAKREIPAGADQPAVISAKRNAMTVMAVSEPDATEISRASIGSNGSVQSASGWEVEPMAPLTDSDARALRAWLSHIHEHDETIIANVLKQCRSDAVAREYFLARANEVHADTDDRRRCTAYGHLGLGTCVVAKPGGIVAANSGYSPSLVEIAQRCAGFSPNAGQRPSRESGLASLSWKQTARPGGERRFDGVAFTTRRLSPIRWPTPSTRHPESQGSSG
jgi:hypothetical protein